MTEVALQGTFAVKVIPGDVVAEDWSIYKTFVEDALVYEQDRIEIVEIFQHLRANHWLAVGVFFDDEPLAFAIVEQRKKRVGVALEIMLLAGVGLAEWQDDLFRALVELAKVYGCNALTLNGRMGWLEVLKRYGFQPVSQSLRLKI